MRFRGSSQHYAIEPPAMYFYAQTTVVQQFWNRVSLLAARGEQGPTERSILGAPMMIGMFGEGQHRDGSVDGPPDRSGMSRQTLQLDAERRVSAIPVRGVPPSSPLAVPVTQGIKTRDGRRPKFLLNPCGAVFRRGPFGSVFCARAGPGVSRLVPSGEGDRLPGDVKRVGLILPCGDTLTVSPLMLKDGDDLCRDLFLPSLQIESHLNMSPRCCVHARAPDRELRRAAVAIMVSRVLGRRLFDARIERLFAGRNARLTALPATAAELLYRLLLSLTPSVLLFF